MRHSWRCTSMVSSSSAAMALSDASSRDSLHTVPIILRSAFFFTHVLADPHAFHRMLIAALKPLARCLCPRCLTTKDEVSDAGTHRDTHRRARKRMDDHALHRSIARARRWIFEGHRMTSKRVKDQLNARSLNPIQVCYC